MSLFRVYVDGALFYHPHMSKLAITQVQIQEDAENIDSLTLSAPHNHPYLSSIHPLASTIVCKKGNTVVFEGRALDNGTDFYNTHTWTCESCLAYLEGSIQPPYGYKGTLRGLLEQFISVHNKCLCCVQPLGSPLSTAKNNSPKSKEVRFWEIVMRRGLPDFVRLPLMVIERPLFVDSLCTHRMSFEQFSLPACC